MNQIPSPVNLYLLMKLGEETQSKLKKLPSLLKVNPAKMCYYSVDSPSIFLFVMRAMQFPNFGISSTNSFQEGDRIALVAFKSMMITHDPKGVLNSWNDSRHFSEREGIKCGRKNRRVTVLDLNSRGLIGSLSPHIGNLSFLREIHLSNNTIQGDIPCEFGRLFRLETLELANKSLVGEIPANLSYCSRLMFLYLARNKLVGKIPIEFVSLNNLRYLSIHFNNFTGSIPPFLGNLTSLETLYLNHNAFEGNIPDPLGQLKHLAYLDLSSNNIFDTVPSSIYNLSSLRHLILYENQLHGSLPQNLGLTLPNLKAFQISHNFFAGSIPMSLSNASKLEVLVISANAFSGQLSVDFKGMKNLRFLNVAGNNRGSGVGDDLIFMNSLVSSRNLQALVISQNRFKGELPHSIANLSTQPSF